MINHIYVETVIIYLIYVYYSKLGKQCCMNVHFVMKSFDTIVEYIYCQSI